MPTEAIRVSNWAQLQEELFFNSYRTTIERYRTTYAFRGMTSAMFDLRPSLMRLGHQQEKLPTIERALLRNFRKYADRDVTRVMTFWEWLSLAQHHGLPTRILDWTYSPFVALHFATDDLSKLNEDAVIWMVDFEQTNQWLASPLRQKLDEEVSLVFSVEMLSELFKDVYQWSRDKAMLAPFVLFFEPPSLDQRIINQFGVFSLMSRLDVDLRDWLDDRRRECPDVVRKIVIPARLKWEVRDKLDQMNLTERVIMPGLDGLSVWLRRWYVVKDPSAPNSVPTSPPGQKRRRKAPKQASARKPAKSPSRRR
ncbi:MAG: FRG domain-containing protein [Alphaproteobacteria bacterium]|nr:FRG domain-containing protein [Alphaproteobacteria bacterium]